MASTFRDKRRLLWGLLTLALIVATAFAPPAFAAPDPVRTGLARLKLSAPFKKQLKRNKVSLTPRLFEVVGGTIDPATGSGSLSLGGKLRFEHGDEEVALRKVRLRLGGSGALKAGGKRLFRLAGGSALRDGFGTDIRGLTVSLVGGSARALNRKLGVNSFHRGTVGSMTISTQPLTLGVISGMASMRLGSGPGSVGSKLAAHCVDPSIGVSAIPPATETGPGTTFYFPVTSGNLSPIGMAGVVSQGGGIQLDNGGSGLPAACPTSNDVTIRIFDLQGDLDNRSVKSIAVVSGPGSPLASLGLDAASAIDLPIDITDTWFNPDPVNLSIESNGSAVSIDAFSASMLNFVIPQPAPVDPSMEFRPGDLFGTIGISARLR